MIWLKVPYIEEITESGRIRRYCALTDYPEIVQRGGWWSEIDLGRDIDGPGWAIVLIRADTKIANSLGREFVPVEDPTLEVVGKTLPKSIEETMEDVWDDAKRAQMVLLADELATLADTEGYVRLAGIDWPQAARILVMLGQRGYGLDKVSTGTFPTRGVLDEFNRSDSSALGSDWTPYWVTGNRCRVVSQQIATQSSTNWSDDYWTPGGVEAVFGDSEAYVTVATKPAGNWYAAELCMRMREPGSTVDCYTVDYKNVAAGQDAWEAYRVDNKTYTQLGATVYAELADGDGVGGEIIGSTITVYHRQGSTWTARLTRTDTSYTVGRIGLYMEGEDTRLDNFGGGSVGGISERAGSRSVSTTEWSLVTDSAPVSSGQSDDGIFQVFVDLSGLSVGDRYQIKVKEKVRSSDTQRVVLDTIVDGVQSEPILVTPPLALIHGWDVTAQRLAGTDRTLSWSIRQLS